MINPDPIGHYSDKILERKVNSMELSSGNIS